MKFISITAAAAMAAGLCGCFGPRLVRSPDLRQAEGSVSFRKTRDAETRIDLALKHLIQPEELIPPGYLYVAWVRGDAETPATKIGALEMDGKLNGELHVLTPLKRFDLFVTAESSADSDSPTGLPLFWATYQD